MKRTVKKLSLSKETLHYLDPANLVQAAGGVTTLCSVSCITCPKVGCTGNFCTRAC